MKLKWAIHIFLWNCNDLSVHYFFK